MTSITIPVSSNYDNNYTNLLETQKIIGKSITDGIATFENGTVINLRAPLLPQDGVSKQFVIASSNPGAPANSVQYNDEGFVGSSNLLYNNGTNTLNISGDISLDPITISGGSINGLIDPISQQQVATKKYVDSFSSTTNTFYIQSDNPVTYTGSQMINGIVVRNIFTAVGKLGVSITDTTASAADLLAASPGATIGSSYKWKLINTDPASNVSPFESRDRFRVLINPGTGVTFDPPIPSFPVQREYTLDTTIIFTSISPPAVKININVNFYDSFLIFWQPNSPLFSIFTDLSNSSSMAVTDNFLYNINDLDINTTNYNYTLSDIRNGFISRSQPGASIDRLDTTIDFPSQMLTIQNNGGGNITIAPYSTISSFTPNPIVIPNGTQSNLSIKTNRNLNISNEGNDYQIQSYPTTGGTGSGLMVYVSRIYTPFNLISTGLNYTIEVANTSGGSGSGLQVLISNVNPDTGEILSIGTIIGYLTGYVAGDILTIQGGDGTAQIQLISLNSINAVAIFSIGDGLYSTGDVLTIINGTTNNAQVTLDTVFSALSILNTPL